MAAELPIGLVVGDNHLAAAAHPGSNPERTYSSHVKKLSTAEVWCRLYVRWYVAHETNRRRTVWLVRVEGEA